MKNKLIQKIKDWKETKEFWKDLRKKSEKEFAEKASQKLKAEWKEKKDENK